LPAEIVPRWKWATFSAATARATACDTFCRDSSAGLIGSGAVELACKTVVGQRLKLAGMRWRKPGTDAICHLRALFKSEPRQWAAFWMRSMN
jgi:hypothetical protein